MCQLPYLKHKYYDIPNLDYLSVYILFARPMGKAKMQYCERCGRVRLVGLNIPDASSHNIKAGGQ